MSLLNLPLELVVAITKSLSNPNDLKNFTETLPYLDALLLPILEASVEKLNCQSALSWAALYGNANLVKRLLENGADVNGKRKGYSDSVTEDTALHKAAMCGEVEVVKLLLEYGCDTNAQMDNIIYFESGTALHCAAFYGNKAVAKLLLDTGFDVSQLSSYGRTPLHIAVCSIPRQDKHYDVIELLLERGADINAQDRDGRTALHMGIGQYIVSSPTSALRVSALLLEKGVEINTQDRWGKTALHCAANEDGFKDVINFLIEKGADVSIKDNSGLAPLDTMIRNRYNVMITGKGRSGKGNRPSNTVKVV